MDEDEARAHAVASRDNWLALGLLTSIRPGANADPGASPDVLRVAHEGYKTAARAAAA